MDQQMGDFIDKGIIIAIILATIMLFTIVGNILVIWAIFTYRPLHNVQNMFLVSLAVSDIAVAMLVMPFNVAYNLLGKWIFGLHLCEMWLTSDVLCCTASILNLCAIAMDRYWAIHDPINYAQKRTMKRVVTSIALIWAISALISIPPLIGWNDWPAVFDEDTPCKLSEEKSYVMYSASGSFFIPLIIMTVVYFKIFKATRRRLRDRAKASAMANLMSNSKNNAANESHKIDIESNSDEKTEKCDKDCEKGCDGSQQKNNKTNKKSNKKGLKDKQKVKANNDLKIDDNNKNEKQDNCEERQIDGQDFVSQVNTSESISPSIAQNIDQKTLVVNQHLATKSETKGSTKNNYRSKASSITCESNDHNIITQVKCRTTDDSSNISVKRFWEEKQKISLSRERRATRILGIVMGVFVACWLPFFLMYVIMPFCHSCYLPKELENFITWLGYINSALNPLIYCGFNRDFRKAFQKIICCKKVI